MKKYYAIKIGKDAPCICTTWKEAQKRIKYPKAKYKGFDTKNEAIKWLGINESKIEIIEMNVKKENNNNFHKCVICKKPINKKGWYCFKCINECKKLVDFFEKEYNKKYELSSIRKIIAIFAEENNKEVKVFEYIKNNPNIFFEYTNKNKKVLKESRIKYIETRRTNKRVSINNVPRYINEFFQDNEDKELIDLMGTEKDVSITFKCVKCEKIITANFDDLKRSNCHICDYSLSKGEFLVKQYLEKNNISFVTQYDTLRCINPETEHILPYDFQLKDYKIIIEVQGDQHTKYIKHFHGTKEAFEYQQYKDKLKKEHAINNGYTFVEIFYNEFSDNSYISKIVNAIESSKTVA